MSVFADTSSLYAAVVRSEERYRECLALFEELLEGGRVITCSNTHSHCRLTAATSPADQAARRVVDWIGAGPRQAIIRRVPIQPLFHRTIWRTISGVPTS